MNVSRANNDHLHEAVNSITDSDAADGDITPKDVIPQSDSAYDLGEASTPRRFQEAHVDRYYSELGALIETTKSSPRRVEYFLLILTIGNDGVNDYFDVQNGTDSAAGSHGSNELTGGFHTPAAAVTATKAATSAGDADANKVFLDTDADVIRIKKDSGDALNAGFQAVAAMRYTVVDISSVQGIIAQTVVADANFTGSPSSLEIYLKNSAGANVDPFSLVATSENYNMVIQGVILK